MIQTENLTKIYKNGFKAVDGLNLHERNVAVGQFSRGMKQRFGIAKSLINHPKIVFLDEPTPAD